MALRPRSAVASMSRWEKSQDTTTVTVHAKTRPLQPRTTNQRAGCGTSASDSSSLRQTKYTPSLDKTRPDSSTDRTHILLSSEWSELSDGNQPLTLTIIVRAQLEPYRPVAGRGGPGVRTPPEPLKVTFSNRPNPSFYEKGIGLGLGARFRVLRDRVKLVRLTVENARVWVR